MRSMIEVQQGDKNVAHIVNFTIEGLAGRRQTYSVGLNRDINIFFGLNGSGKTSLLKILDSAMGLDTLILANVPFRSAEVSIYSSRYDKVFTRSIDQTTEARSSSPTLDDLNDDELLEGHRLNLSRNVKPMTWTTKPKVPKSSSGRFARRYLPTSRLHLGALLNQRGGEIAATGYLAESEERLDAYFASIVTQLWVEYYSEVTKKVGRAQADGLANILKTILSGNVSDVSSELDNPLVTYQRVSAFLDRQGSTGALGPLDEFNARYLGDPHLATVVNDIDTVETRIERAMQPRLELEGMIQQMFSGDKEIHFTDNSIEVETETGNKISLSSLSSGEKHLMRILIETLLAGESSLIIDEPEISMHVDWQRHLIEAMRKLNPDTQLIIATHSPEIMAEVADDKIFRI